MAFDRDSGNSYTIPTNRPRDWETARRAAGADDVYYGRDYVTAYEANGEGVAELFVLERAAGTVVYPYIKRRIRLRGEDTGLRDIVSPYGYSGPVLSARSPESAALAEAFVEAFGRHCSASSIVSEFVRYHPLLENHRSFEGPMNPEYVRDTVYVDMTAGEEAAWRGFDSTVRRNVRKSERGGLSVAVEPGRGPDGESDRGSGRWFEEFVGLYESTMRRLSASGYYYFSPEYFAALEALLGAGGELLLASYEDELVGAMYLLRGERSLHYHLGAWNHAYQHLRITDALYWAAVRRGTALGLDRLHLGGGYRDNDDTLFRYKQKFSSLRAGYYVARKIHLPEKYEELSRLHLGDTEYEAARQGSGFFPLYRSPDY